MFVSLTPVARGNKCAEPHHVHGAETVAGRAIMFSRPDAAFTDRDLEIEPGVLVLRCTAMESAPALTPAISGCPSPSRSAMPTA